MSEESDRLRSVRKARYANWPREKILLLASVLMTGPSQNAVSVQGFLDQAGGPVGQSGDVHAAPGARGRAAREPDAAANRDVPRAVALRGRHGPAALHVRGRHPPVPADVLGAVCRTRTGSWGSWWTWRRGTRTSASASATGTSAPPSSDIKGAARRCTSLRPSSASPTTTEGSSRGGPLGGPPSALRAEPPPARLRRSVVLRTTPRV